MTTQKTTVPLSTETGANSKSLLCLGLGILLLALFLAFVMLSKGDQLWLNLFTNTYQRVDGQPLVTLARGIGLPIGETLSLILLAAGALVLWFFLALRYRARRLVSRRWAARAAFVFVVSMVGFGVVGTTLHLTWLVQNLRILPSLLLVSLSLFAAIELHRESKNQAAYFSRRSVLLVLALAFVGSYAVYRASPTLDLLPWVAGLLLCFVALSFLLTEGSWAQDTALSAIVAMTILQGSAFAYAIFSRSLSGENHVSAALFFASFLVPILTISFKIFRLYYEMEQRRWSTQAENIPRYLGNQEVPKETLNYIVKTQMAPILVLNASGQVIFVSEGYSKMLDRTLSKMIGQAPDDWTTPLEGGPYMKQILSQVSVRKKPESHTMRHQLASGKYLDANITVQPVFDTYGCVNSFIITEQDLSQGAERTLLLKQILENMHLGICLLDVPSLRIVHANAYALVLLRRIGFPSLETFSDLYSAFRTAKNEAYPQDSIPLDKTLQTGEEAECDDIAILDQKKSTASTIWHMHATPIFDHTGKLQQVLLSFDDVTSQKGVIQTMTDYVSIIAHQLRTPLSVLRWSLDEIRDNASMTDAQKHNVYKALSETTDGMRGIVQSLLSLCTIESGKVPNKPVRLKLDDLVGEVFKEFQSLLEKKKITLQTSVLQTLPECELDAGLARQMMQKLIENAVQYTPDGGTIDSILSVENNRVHWMLHDTGIGIAKDDLARIFEKFHRGDNAQHVSAYGLGLGVYTAKLIANELQCQIKCESEEGHGTTFHVYFGTGLPGHA